MSRVWTLSLVALVTCIAACGNPSNATPNNTVASTTVIARVGSQTITQNDLNIRLQAAMTLQQQSGAPTPKASSDPMLQQLRARVLSGLIADAVIAQEANFRHVAVTTAQVSAQIQQDEAAAGGSDKLQTQLAQAGETLAQLEDEARSNLNEQNLENYFAQQRAQAALAALNAGETFASVASIYSDDTTSNTKGGDLGVVTLSALDGNDSAFKSAVLALHVGALSTQPTRDQSGYEILRLDAETSTTVSLHRILVAAPQTYTVMQRPQWFSQSLLQAVEQLCSAHQLTVYIDPSVQPCTAPISSPSP